MRAFKFFFFKLTVTAALVQCLSFSKSVAQEFLFPGKTKKDAISFSLIRNLVVIGVYINEKGPYNFILDTGVGPMILTDSAIVADMDVSKLRSIKISGLGQGLEIEALLSNEVKARVGKSSISFIPTAILKEDVLGLSNFVGMRISGLLGYHFFNSFLVRINYSSKRLVFYRPDTGKKPKGERVPITLFNNKPYTDIEVDIPGKGKIQAKVVVDNGASHAISMETLDKIKFPVPEGAISANLGIGLNGPISGSIGRINSLKIGSYQFKNAISAYPSYSAEIIKDFLTDRNGNLGADVLSRFNITFDYAGGAMYLQRNANFKRPFEHDMSGMEIYEEDDVEKRFFVNRVEPGSPAEIAGIKMGDELLNVNFSKAKITDLDLLNKLLRSGDGQVLFFSLNRGGELLVKLIKLKKRI